jgi:hypothetical protein
MAMRLLEEKGLHRGLDTQALASYDNTDRSVSKETQAIPFQYFGINSPHTERYLWLPILCAEKF